MEFHRPCASWTITKVLLLTQTLFVTLNQNNLTLVRHLWKDNVWYFLKNNNFWQAAELFVKLFEWHRKKRKNKITFVFHAACLHTLIREQWEVQWFLLIKEDIVRYSHYQYVIYSNFTNILPLYLLRFYLCRYHEKKLNTYIFQIWTFSAINEKSKFLETSFNFWALFEKTRKKKYKTLILMSALGILTWIKDIQRMKQYLVVSNRTKKIIPNFFLNTFF